MTGHPDGAAICVRLNVFMLRAPLIATPAIVVVVAVIVPLLSGEFVSVSIVAGLIAVIGAWCVPATYTQGEIGSLLTVGQDCLLYTSPSPRDRTRSRMPSSA